MKRNRQGKWIISEKQLPLPEPERVIELPEFLECGYHGGYAPRAYYDDDEIIEMIDGQGWIDCPLCLAGIVGVCE
jgi:hypothetical protein